MQDLVEATHVAITREKLSELRCFNCSIIELEKIESHFENWSSDAQRINLTFVAHSFVENFVRYISAKYYFNWFSFHTVIMKVLLGVNFFLKHSVVSLSRFRWHPLQQCVSCTALKIANFLCCVFLKRSAVCNIYIYLAIKFMACINKAPFLSPRLFILPALHQTLARLKHCSLCTLCLLTCCV